MVLESSSEKLQLFQDELWHQEQPCTTSSSVTSDHLSMQKQRQQERPPPPQPDQFTISLMLVPLIKAGRIGDVEGLIDQFVATYAEHVVSESFGTFLISLVQAGEINTARALFDTYVFPTLSSNDDSRKRTSRLSSSSKQNIRHSSSSTLRRQQHQKQRNFHKNSALLIRPTILHFNVLIDGYRRLLEHYKKKKKSIQWKREKEANPSSSSSLSTRSNKFKTGRIEQDSKNGLKDNDEETIDPEVARQEGWSIYRLMMESDNEWTPDDYTVTTMMGLCSTSEELSDYLFPSQLEQRMSMQERFTSPVVLRAAMTAYGHAKDPSSACILFDKFSRSSSKNIRNWNVLLRALADGAKYKVGNLDLTGNKSKTFMALKMETGDDATNEENNLNELPDRNDLDVSSKDEDQSDPFPLVTLLDGKPCPEAAQIVLNSMQSQSSKEAPPPNIQSYCIAASALQHAPTTDASVALELFRNATLNDGLPADGRFVNAVFRCFADDIDAALTAWKGEIRSACLAHEQRRRRVKPSERRSSGKNLIASYNGLLHVCGRALRPDIAVRVAYAMNREGIEPNDVSLNCYHSGKRLRQRLERDAETSDSSSNAEREDNERRNSKTNQGPQSGTNNFGFVSRLGRKLGLVDQYENLLYVECTKYDRNDRRRSGDKRVRIIV